MSSLFLIFFLCYGLYNSGKDLENNFRVEVIYFKLYLKYFIIKMRRIYKWKIQLFRFI